MRGGKSHDLRTWFKNKILKLIVIVSDFVI